MLRTARALLPLAVFFLLTGCGTAPKPKTLTPPTAEVAPSPNLYAGRILAVDLERHFAFVALSPSSPPAVLQPDLELITRSDELRVSAHLRTTRQVRGRTLGAQIISGQPAVGDEVVLPTLR
ncbi:MAG: hypothetical protein WCQ44_09655 [Opitutaceae bacterium]